MSLLGSERNADFASTEAGNSGMTFDIKRLLHLYARAVLVSGGTHARLTKKRVFVLLGFFPLLILIGCTHLAGFLLDELFFRGYRTLAVRKPVFIVGVFRSGTTFLHRLLAQDTRRFTSMRLWEILFAPSVTQKRFWLAVGRLDRRLGRPLGKRIAAWEEKTFATLHTLHRLSLFEPEEDDPILLNIFSSFFQYFGFPFEDEPNPFVRFDTALDPGERARIMGFYKRCVQRHLYVFGPEKQFLSKNPVFSPKVRSLRETFPDAKVICMVRSPLSVIPSTLSLFSLLYRFVNDPLEPHPMREATLAMIAHWYRYPLEQLDGWPRENHKVLAYNELVGDDPAAVVLSIYRRFGFAPGPGFRRILSLESGRARAYRSGHAYSLEEIGLEPAEIVAAYRDLFLRFGFDTRGQLHPSGDPPSSGSSRDAAA